jgi:hypothetical protein
MSINFAMGCPAREKHADCPIRPRRANPAAEGKISPSPSVAT